MQGEKAEIKYNQNKIDSIVIAISSYNEFCKARNIEFVFLPCPNKESLYYDYAGLDKQPDFLHKLHIALKERGIKTINLLEKFNVEKNNQLLYHYDDTHWNSKTSHIVTQELISCLYQK